MACISTFATIKNFSITRSGKPVHSGQGDLEEFLHQAYHTLKINYPKFFKMDRLSRLGMLAGEILLQQHRLSDSYQPEEIAVVLANRAASLDADQRYFQSTKQIASPSLFVYTLPNIVAGELCIRHVIKGENAFFVMDEFDTNRMVDYVETVLNAGNTKACLAGWVDVLGDQHDVFLYLAENEKKAASYDHTAATLTKLYRGDYGTIDGES